MISGPCRFLVYLAPFIPLSAHAIVNIEGVRVAKPEPGWSGRLEWVVGGRTGNVDKQNIDAALRLDWHGAPNTAFLILQRQYGEAAGIPNEDSTFMHLRGIRELTPAWAAESFLQHERDDFRRLTARSLAGGGGRLRLAWQPERVELYLGLGAFYFDERLDPLTGEGNQSGVRLNTYVAYKGRWTAAVSIASTTYLQPRLDAPTDLRALEQASLVVKASENIDLQLGLDVVHDSEPPAGVKATDISYRTSLVYRF